MMIDASNGDCCSIGDGRFELLVKTGELWTPMGWFRTRRFAAMAVKRLAPGKPFLVEDHKPTTNLPYVAVVRLSDRKLMFMGRDEERAAKALRRDMTFGVGRTKKAAREAAERSAARIVARREEAIRERRRSLLRK